MNDDGLTPLLWVDGPLWNRPPAPPTGAERVDGDRPWPAAVWLRPALERASADVTDRWTGAVARTGIAAAIGSTQLDPPGREPELRREPPERHWLLYEPDHADVRGADFDGVGTIVLHLGRSDGLQGWHDRPLPSDVNDIETLSLKADQLRRFLPDDGRLVLSLPAETLGADLPPALEIAWDAILVRAVQPAWFGLPLAALTRHVRRQLDAAGLGNMPLGVAPPPEMQPGLDRMLGLGASFAVIDDLINAILYQDVPVEVRGDRTADFQRVLVDGLGRELVQTIEDPDRMRRRTLATTDPEWARTLGLPLISIGR